MKPKNDRSLSTTILLLLLPVLSLFIATSCSRLDMEELGGPAKKVREPKCIITGFQLNYPSIPTRSLFSSEVTPSGRDITMISVGLYSGGGITDTVKLNISYGKDVVYMVSATNPADTGLKVYLNKEGRVIRADIGSPIHYLPPSQYFYYGSDGRLSEMVLGENAMRFWFRYDAYGNNTEIVSDSTNGVARIHHQYEYDHSISIPKQFYQDEPRGFSMDVYTILHAAGFFPEVDGVHARTRTTVFWSQYKAGDYDLSEHQVANGRLLRYNVRIHASPTQVPLTFNINYSCRGNEAFQ